MQKLQDIQTVLAAIHLLFKIVINLKILKNSQEYVHGDVFVYKTAKLEVINFAFLNRDLPLNNSAIMVKRKYLKLLYSSKECIGLTVN